MKKVALVVCLLGVLLTSAFGQGTFLHAKIPFEFVAGGQTFPAGNYDFSASNQAVTMQNMDTRERCQLGFLTRVAADGLLPGAAISYDVQDGKRFIETIWPSSGDGYLIHMVKGEHTHMIVRGK